MKSNKPSYIMWMIITIIVIVALLMVVFTKAIDVGGIIFMAIIGVFFVIGAFSESSGVGLVILMGVAAITIIFTEAEFRIFDIPRKHIDAIWLCNGVLFYVAYFCTLWYKKSIKEGIRGEAEKQKLDALVDKISDKK